MELIYANFVEFSKYAKIHSAKNATEPIFKFPTYVKMQISGPLSAPEKPFLYTIVGKGGVSFYLCFENEFYDAFSNSIVTNLCESIKKLFKILSVKFKSIKV